MNFKLIEEHRVSDVHKECVNVRKEKQKERVSYMLL